LYFSGITHEQTIKVQIGIIKALMISTLPSINVLTSWIKTGGGQLSSPLTFSNVRKQILWGNRFITFEKKYLFFKEWIN
jgi:hypothetical protein